MGQLSPRAPAAAVTTLVTDAMLVERVLAGDLSAERLLYDRHAPYVSRVLARVLGAHAELPDHVHDTFITALASLGRLKTPSALRPWLAGIAVNVARAELRRRRRRRWLSFGAPSDLPEVAAEEVDPEVRAAARAIQRVVDGMPTELQLAFSLRYFGELQLEELARALGVSLATAKRRIARADELFRARAQAYPELAGYIDHAER